MVLRVVALPMAIGVALAAAIMPKWSASRRLIFMAQFSFRNQDLGVGTSVSKGLGRSYTSLALTATPSQSIP